MPLMAQILIFGDSISFGFWDKEGGWVDRLKRALASKSIDSDLEKYCSLYNLGVPGDTTDGLLERFKEELKARKNDYEDYILIFAIGINDSHFVGSARRHKVALERFEQNLKKIVKLAKEVTEKIVFVGLLPVDESRTDPLYWIPDRAYTNQSVIEYDQEIKQICLEQGVHFIEIFQSFKVDHYIGLLEDGLHPTSEGHRRILELVKKYLEENKII